MGLARGAAVAVALAALALVGGCAEGVDRKATPDELRSVLIRASSVPGYRLQRTLLWDRPADVVFEALRLPESTRRSHAIRFLEKQGFQAGAGQWLTDDRGAQVRLAAIELGSISGARNLHGYARAEAFEQPCWGVCGQQASEFDVGGMPGASGIQQRPLGDRLPIDPRPFTSFQIAFTRGKRLYLVVAVGPPGMRSDAAMAAAGALYHRATGKAPGT
jgi:hypothetical protein